MREEEDHEMEDLMKHMHKLSVHEESYAVLYMQRAQRFPEVAHILPKPIIAQHASLVSHFFLLLVGS